MQVGQEAAMIPECLKSRLYTGELHKVYVMIIYITHNIILFVGTWRTADMVGICSVIPATPWSGIYWRLTRILSPRINNDTIFRTSQPESLLNMLLDA